MPILDLVHFPQPEHNEPASVETALESLRTARDEASAAEAHDAFLWSIGDNHAGTFYPVVLAVLPDVEKLLVGGGYWAQRAAIEALIDLGGSFTPHEGFETYLGGSVQATLKTFVRSLRQHVAPLAIGDDPRARSAAELVELIDDLSD